jgi:chondroitin sulfate synthase
MQVILYHNQSGQAAFSGDLKQKEVHRAITLHPVKQPQYMYRLDKYVKVGIRAAAVGVLARRLAQLI